jgi:hypothetical protein
MIALLFLLWATVAPDAQAKISANTPSYLPSYEDLDRLEAYGCAYPTYRALTPQASYDLHTAFVADSEEKPCQAPEWLLQERLFDARYPQPNELRIESVWLHNDLTPLLGTEALVTPLFPLRENRTTFNGPNLYTELTANTEVSLGEFGLALSATPGWLGALDDYRHFDGRFYLHEGYVKAGYRWAELTFGRMALRFGETAHGSLLLSAATQPIDLISFAIRPHLLGSFLDYLGPFTFETFLTPPATSAFVDNARLWGVEMGIRPFSWFELSLLELYQFGGDGVPGLDLGEFLRMLPYGGGSDLNARRNRNLGVDLAFWLPGHSAKLYSQLMFDNLDAVSNWLDRDMSVLTGLWLPRLGSWDLRLEYVHTVPDAYLSALYKQGFTYDSSILGHPLGPDAQGVYLDAGLPAWALWRPTVGILYEQRGIHLSGQVSPESRYGFTAGAKKRWSAVEFDLQLAYHLIKNPLYEADAATPSAFAAFASWRYTF